MTMDDAVVADISGAIDRLLGARRLVADAFGVTSASGLVRRVRDGEIPRHGRLPNGMEYLVHGIGYTVVYNDGRGAHLDACDGGAGDCFKAYDVRQILQDICVQVPSLELIRQVCDDWVARGRLGTSGEATYMVVDPEVG